LHLAAHFGLHRTANALISQTSDLDINLKILTRVPLHAAAARGHNAVLSVLLESDGIDGGITDENNHTALACAVKSGHEETVCILFERGAYIYETNDNSEKLLSIAVVHDRVGVIKLLIEKGADINMSSARWPRRAPLCHAIAAGAEGATRFLLERGADINQHNKSGTTVLLEAIEIAAYRSKEEFIHILLEKGADVNMQLSDGTSPLLIATQRSSEHLVRLILDKGATVDLPDSHGRIPLFYLKLSCYNLSVFWGDLKLNYRRPLILL
jgi:ankyrin repeat protein